MSTIAVNAITDASGGNTASINGATPTTDNTMGKNRLINGDMRIDQRNAGASVAVTDSAFLVDRWQTYVSQTGKLNAQQNAGSVTPPAGFVNYLGYTSLSAYSVGASEQFICNQPIEGFNIADFAWGTSDAKTVTLSFWVRSSLTGTHSGGLRNGAGNRSYVYTFSVSAADTWEYKTITIPGDTSGTWLTTNGYGTAVQFNLGCGSSASTAAGSWGAGNFAAATGATSVVGTNGATFYITGVQLEAGSVATSFERRPYGQELALCQRYYWILRGNSSGGYAAVGSGNVHSGLYPRTYIKYPVSMRSLPSIGYGGTVRLNSAGTTLDISAVDSVWPGLESAMVSWLVGTSLTTGDACIAHTLNDSASYFYGSAEL